MPKKMRTRDRFALYEAAVQSMDFDIHFLPRLFKSRTGRTALSLREDFCGTYALCCEWVKSHRERTAIGLDLSRPTLAYGTKNHWQKLKPSQQQRVKVFCQNVKSKTKAVDFIVAQNFSFYTFRTRAELTEYFKKCRASLREDGMFLIDMFGGPEAETPLMENHRVVNPRLETFTYYWELRSFEPVTRFADFYIHFGLKNGKVLKNAFRYQWRMWTIAEVREMMLEAGFGYTEVLWEGDSGRYFRTEKGDSDETWLAYVIAGKKKWRHS